MIKLFTGYTQYQFLLFLLLNKNDLYILLQPNLKKYYEVLKKYDYRVEKLKFSYKSGILNYIKYYIYIKKILKKMKSKEKYILYGESTLSNLLSRSNSLYLLEDGVGNYLGVNLNLSTLEKIKILLQKIIYYIIFRDKKFPIYSAVDKRVEKVYLTGLAPIPKEIAHKVEIIDLKELWNKKTLEEQNEILDIFSFDLNIKEKIKGRDIILFTQPLSEDNVIAEEEKLKLYSEIIKKYPKERLVIKTHPREKTNYKDIFKEYLVLDNPFPFEILNLLDIKFNKAITLFSTAALGLGEGVEVDFYGTEVHAKILKRFGSCDNIMKRNCFLKEE